jgi:hypothetical protein
VDSPEEHDPRFDPPRSLDWLPAAASAPPGQYESLYFSHEVADLLPLAEELTRQGVPFRVEPTDEAHGVGLPRTRYDLTVREAEREIALGALEAFLGSEEEGMAAEGSGTSMLDEGERCPACGDPIGEADMECAGCGLTLGGLDPGA